MARAFRRRGKNPVTFTAVLDANERAVVADMMTDVALLLGGQTDTAADLDPLAAALGPMSADAPSVPTDPALARLLPTAHAEDDDVATEFRRLTETGLRSRKTTGLLAAAAMLGHGDDVVLTPAEAATFATALTDVRLVLGERLDLRTDDDHEQLTERMSALDEDDPLQYAVALYDFVTWLQDSLAQALIE